METRATCLHSTLQHIVHRTQDTYAVQVSELSLCRSNITYPQVEKHLHWQRKRHNYTSGKSIPIDWQKARQTSLFMKISFVPTLKIHHTHWKIHNARHCQMSSWLGRMLPEVLSVDDLGSIVTNGPWDSLPNANAANDPFFGINFHPHSQKLMPHKPINSTKSRNGNNAPTGSHQHGWN